MIILASASPRRQELLRLITSDFCVRVNKIDETPHQAEPPDLYVKRMSLHKAKGVQQKYPDSLLIGADTVVVLGERILGKPKNNDDALAMLRLLSGETHEVYTAVTVLWKAREETLLSRTLVSFFPLTDQEIYTYLNTGEPMDKAGAYGIQGKGALLIESIQGDYYSVMGLPVAPLARVLASMGAC